MTFISEPSEHPLFKEIIFLCSKVSFSCELSLVWFIVSKEGCFGLMIVGKNNVIDKGGFMALLNAGECV